MILQFRNKIENADKQGVGPHSIKIVDLPKRLNNPSLRFELRQGEVFSGGGCRSELMYPNTPKNSELWVGASVFLPEFYEDENGNKINNKENIMSSKDWLSFIQLHARPDSGEPNAWPILSIEIVDGKWKIQSNYDTNAKTVYTNSQNTTIKRNPTIWAGIPEFNKWTDWTIHIKQFADNRGLLEVYKDGILVGRIINEPVCYNDASGSYLKVGIYTKDTQKKPLVCYIAEMTLMDGQDKFKDVDVRSRSGQNTPTVPPENEEFITTITYKIKGKVEVTDFLIDGVSHFK